MGTAPMTVVETGEFLKRVKPLLSDSERAEFWIQPTRKYMAHMFVTTMTLGWYL